MSEPFDIGDAGSIQEHAEQLRLAFSERTHIMSRVADSDRCRNFLWDGTAQLYKWQDCLPVSEAELAGGVNLQAAVFWSGLQQFFTDEPGLNFLSAICVPGVDYSGLAVPGFGAYADPWLEFCKWVGNSLYASDTDYGWPRAVPATPDGRGSHQQGDYIHPRLIAALVDAFSHATSVRGVEPSVSGPTANGDETALYGPEPEWGALTVEEARANAWNAVLCNLSEPPPYSGVYLAIFYSQADPYWDGDEWFPGYVQYVVSVSKHVHSVPAAYRQRVVSWDAYYDDLSSVEKIGTYGPLETVTVPIELPDSPPTADVYIGNPPFYHAIIGVYHCDFTNANPS